MEAEMLPLIARLTTDTRTSDNRNAVRRSLRLEVRAFSRIEPRSALIRNLSERGLLIETATDLAIGETIHVDLPEAGTSEARIVWRKGSFFGCEFLTPVSRAAVSAALLLAPLERAPTTELPALPENSVFARDRAQMDYEPQPYSAGADTVLMISLIVALFMAALFIYALLTFPFST
jgi:hypothetical protein